MSALIAQIELRASRSHRGLRFALKLGCTNRQRNATEEGGLMERHVVLGSGLLAALAGGAVAQDQSPTAQQESKSSNAPQTITVTGCLKADSASPSAAPGAPGAPAASAAAGGFILEASASGAAAAPGEKPSP